MFHFYVPLKILLLPMLFAFIALWMGLWLISLFLLIFGFLLAHIFRKKSKAYLNNLRDNDTVIVSPVNGKVYSHYSRLDTRTGEERVYLRIIMDHFVESGLYLPCSSELKSLKDAKGKRHFRYLDTISLEKEGHTSLSFISKFGKRMRVHLFPCLTGMKPICWIQPGDRGKGGANFGFFPLGGSVLMDFPKECKILVEKGQKLVSNDTIVAAYE